MKDGLQYQYASLPWFDNLEEDFKQAKASLGETSQRLCTTETQKLRTNKIQDLNDKTDKLKAKRAKSCDHRSDTSGINIGITQNKQAIEKIADTMKHKIMLFLKKVIQKINNPDDYELEDIDLADGILPAKCHKSTLPHSNNRANRFSESGEEPVIAMEQLDSSVEADNRDRNTRKSKSNKKDSNKKQQPKEERESLLEIQLIKAVNDFEGYKNAQEDRIRTLPEQIQQQKESTDNKNYKNTQSQFEQRLGTLVKKVDHVQKTMYDFINNSDKDSPNESKRKAVRTGVSRQSHLILNLSTQR